MSIQPQSDTKNNSVRSLRTRHVPVKHALPTPCARAVHPPLLICKQQNLLTYTAGDRTPNYRI